MKEFVYLFLMSSTLATQWSAALGLDISSVTANSAGLQQLGQKMADFIAIRAQQSVLDKINTTMDEFRIPDGPHLVVNNTYGVVVNEQTQRLADSFLVDAKTMMEGSWPAAWDTGAKDPALLLISYLSGAAAHANKQEVQWTTAVTRMMEVYTKTHGPDALMAEVDALDQLLPQVLTGAAAALLDSSGLDRMQTALKSMRSATEQSVVPKPSALLQVLLDSRSPPVPEYAF